MLPPPCFTVGRLLGVMRHSALVWSDRRHLLLDIWGVPHMTKGLCFCEAFILIVFFLSMLRFLDSWSQSCTSYMVATVTVEVKFSQSFSSEQPAVSLPCRTHQRSPLLSHFCSPSTLFQVPGPTDLILSVQKPL